MQKSFTVTENNILPPNVKGKIRGFFEIEISYIKWNSKYLENRFKNLEIILQFSWWGQEKTTASRLTLNQSKLNENPIIKYSILTNSKLFYNYLSNCEPIKVNIYTKVSNYQIGVSRIKIPFNIIKSCNEFLTEDTIACTESQKYIIKDKKNIQIGELTLKFKMMFYEPISNRENYSYQTLKIDSDKEIEVINSSRSYKQFKEARKCEKGVPLSLRINEYISSARSNKDLKEKNKSDEAILSSRAVDYLSGRKMSKIDEDQALNEIHRVSPLNEKFLECLSINIPDSPTLLPSDTLQYHQLNNNCSCWKIKDKIDSLYISLKYVKLLASGIREVFVKSLVKRTFTVECKISPTLLDSALKNISNYDVIRFYSNTFDDKEQRVDFNKDASRSIKLACNSYNQSLTEHADILFTVWWREYGSRYSRCLGTTKFRFTNMCKNFENESNVELEVRSCAAGVHVANLYCKIFLGSNLKDHNESNYNFQIPSVRPSSLSSCTFNPIISTSHCCGKQNPHNENYSNNNEREKKVSKNSSPRETNNSQNINNNKNESPEERQDEKINIAVTNRSNPSAFRTFKGLIFIGQMRNVENSDNSNFFCVIRAFWKDDSSSSGFPHENNFNFIENFSIINDAEFLNRTYNNVLVVELWQKSKDSHEKLFGIVKLSLHQFYIAFRDSVLTEHLCKSKLPVISSDGFVPITSPLSGIICGEMQALLCIGTDEQINTIKLARGLNTDSVLHNNYNKKSSATIAIPTINCNEKLNKNIPKNGIKKTVSENNSSDNDNSEEVECTRRKKEKLSDILGNFLDSLSQKLPPQQPTPTPPLLSSTNINVEQDKQCNLVRPTSELFDMLQKALDQPVNLPIPGRTTLSLDTIGTQTTNLNTFKVNLEIECALHLPRNPNKMLSKRNSKRNRIKQSRFPPNEEPSAYISFQAEEGQGKMYKSHEGMIYATNIIEKSSNPSWNKKFDIKISTDYLTKENNPFILRVWKKSASDYPVTSLQPTPIEDSIIGVVSVDVSVLNAGLPLISGWYNIIDFSGKINGQLKLTIKPLEDLQKFKLKSNDKNLNLQQNKISNSSSSTAGLDLGDLGLDFSLNMSLSKAFKRKLIELDEINQRLRARLLDVTGEADSDLDLSEIDDDQMDEFEKDLNTECKEDDFQSVPNSDGQVGHSSQEFSWLNDNNETFKESNNENIAQDISQNCINHEKIQIISDFLKNTEISNQNSGTSTAATANQNE